LATIDTSECKEDESRALALVEEVHVHEEPEIVSRNHCTDHTEQELESVTVSTIDACIKNTNFNIDSCVTSTEGFLFNILNMLLIEYKPVSIEIRISLIN
jgi:hypothetical protein